MTNAVLSLTKALDFAARKHTDHRRKGDREEPYINHLAEVARLLADATDGDDLDLVLAGLLHDTIEDTETTYDELVTEFGTVMADLVAEVTDDKSLERAERKRRQVETAPGKSDRAKMIKIADKTSNLRSIIASPPADWSSERKREYFEWAREVVSGCRGANAKLEGWFDEAYASGTTTLE